MAEETKQACELVEGIAPFTSLIPDNAFKFTLDPIHTMQVNLGKKCNLVCKHCHIEAGPNRTEAMSRETMQDCLNALDAYPFATIDITGGAPEMCPDFEWFLDQVHERSVKCIVRSNLVILKEPEYEHLIQKYTDYGVNVVTSLPADTERECDSQRGEGSFAAIISVLQELTRLGYGTDPKLQLDLVFNPRGAIMPPDQAAMENQYRKKLREEYGIEFSNLFAFTNNPIGRFGAWLERSKTMKRYMRKLASSFNPDTCESMMCRDQIMVDWDGKVYDCDFNLVCGLTSVGIDSIKDLATGSIPSRPIRFGQHCYACCAGAGSS